MLISNLSDGLHTNKRKFQDNDNRKSPDYIENMSSSIHKKASKMLTLLETGLGKHRLHGKMVLDLGSCDGQLLKYIKKIGQTDRFFDIGFDIVEVALKSHINKRIGLTDAIQGNFYQMPIRPETIDAITMSSCFHEVYSYAANKNSNNEYVLTPRTEMLEKFSKNLIKISECLVPGGIIAISDPACPKEPDKKLTLIFSDQNEINSFYNFNRYYNHHETTEQKAEISNQLKLIMKSSDPKLHTLTLPSWFVSEWLRHRWLPKDEQAQEGLERYGVITEPDLNKLLKDTKLTVQSYNLKLELDHVCVQNVPGITITDEGGSKLQPKDFMFTHCEILLKKNSA